MKGEYLEFLSVVFSFVQQLVHQERTSLKVHQVESALASHAPMRITLLHQEVPPLRIVHAGRDIVLWDKAVKVNVSIQEQNTLGMHNEVLGPFCCLCLQC